jgi:hypothetical protein
MHLLPPGHEWVAVPASGWAVVQPPRKLKCLYGKTSGSVEPCLAAAVATCGTSDDGRAVKTPTGRCIAHIGAIRWIDGDTVMQWRARSLAGAA